MENLAPSFECSMEIIYLLENGLSLNMALSYYSQASDSEFAVWLQIWLFNTKQGLSNELHLKKLQSDYQRALVYSFSQGLKGVSILPQLRALQEEIEKACEDEVSKFLSLLPFKLMIPIFLFQFPAYLILLLGPILTDLIRSMNL